MSQGLKNMDPDSGKTDVVPVHLWLYFVHDISIGYSWPNQSHQENQPCCTPDVHRTSSEARCALLCFWWFRMWQSNVGNKKKQSETTCIIAILAFKSS